MIGISLVLLFAAPTPTPKAPSKPVKAVRPMTQAEEDAEIERQWNSKGIRDLSVPDAGVIAPFQWRLGNIIRQIPIDGVQTVDDVPVKLHAVTVKGRSEDIAKELIAHFLKSGLYMVPFDKQDQPLRQLQVTALDHNRSISYTALIDQQADGNCTVVLGEANIGASVEAGRIREAKKLPAQDFAPLMAQAQSPTRVNIEGMRSLGYSVKSTEPEVRKFYQSELKKLGFAESEPDIYRKKNDQIQLQIKREPDRLHVLLTARQAIMD